MPVVRVTSVLPTLRLENIVGALTSYQSFLEKGSTLRARGAAVRAGARVSAVDHAPRAAHSAARRDVQRHAARRRVRPRSRGETARSEGLAALRRLPCSSPRLLCAVPAAGRGAYAFRLPPLPPLPLLMRLFCERQAGVASAAGQQSACAQGLRAADAAHALPRLLLRRRRTLPTAMVAREHNHRLRRASRKGRVSPSFLCRARRQKNASARPPLSRQLPR
jgi:hypothetical protein